MRRIGARYLRRLTSRPGFDMDRLVGEFWDRNMHKIMDWYQPWEDDVVFTASFDLLVGEACRRLGVGRCIGSTLDMETLEVGYLNFGPGKPVHLLEKVGEGAVVDAFYTDSGFDAPMVGLARKAYLVEGGWRPPYQVNDTPRRSVRPRRGRPAPTGGEWNPSAP